MVEGFDARCRILHIRSPRGLKRCNDSCVAAQIINRTEHNGIPLLWSDIRTTYSGALIFGVGVQDELARTSGVSHLLEHLVMSQVGEVTINHNASTDGETLSFYAQGPAAHVADFLNRVGASILGLASVTVEAINAETSHIAAELGDGNERTGSGPLLERFGAATLGLIDLGFPAHRSLAREDALEWAATWLHAGNAVIALSGPVPDGLDIHLPPAHETPVRATPAALPYRRHGWIVGGRLPLATTIEISHPDRNVKYVTGAVIGRALLEGLRMERHLVYSVDGAGFPLGPDSSSITLVLDPQPADIFASAEAVLEVIRGLASEGPSQRLMDRIVEEERNLEEDSDALYANLIGAAGRWVRAGVQPLGLDHAPIAGVDATEVKQTIAAALDTILVSLGDFDTDLTPEQVSERLALPWARDPKGHYESMSSTQMFKALMKSDSDTFEPKMFSKLRGQQIMVDPDRVAWASSDYGLVECRWDDIVLAGHCRECGMWDLTDHTGGGFVVKPGLWRSGEKLVARFEAKLPPAVRYPVEHAPWH